MTTLREETIDAYGEHLNPAFIRLLGTLGYGRVMTRAEGVYIEDDAGTRYLDCLSGFGSSVLGHNHPGLASAIIDFLNTKPLNLCHTGPSPHTASFARRLARHLPDPLQIMLLASSGSEAVEAAMKLACVYTKRSEFIYCDGGFHGTNPGTLAIMGETRMRKPFESILTPTTMVPFGELPALERALKSRRAAAFIVEPIQSEGGVRIPPPGYLRAAQDLCRRYGTLLVADEVQTGLGRTGTFFATDAETPPVVPDVLILAKALGAGLVPISACITSAAIHKKAYGTTDRFDLHSSTYGGNALACAVAEATLDLIEAEGLVARSATLGDLMLEKLRTRLAGHPLVKDIRGRGLLIGVELGPTDKGWMNKLAPALVSKVSEQVFGQWAAVRLLERGFICQPASHRWDVLRIEPPLTIDEAHVDSIVEAVGEVMDSYEGLGPLVKDVTSRLARQYRGGWGF